MEKQFVEFSLQMEISDMIFNQHMKSYMPLNLAIITLQFIMLFVALALDIFFDLHASRAVCLTNIILCIVVIINNLIHQHTWKKARRRAKTIYKGISYLCCDDLNSEHGQELYNRYMAALVPTGYHAKHMKDSNKN